MIAKNHVPVVKLVPVNTAPPVRVLGALAGKIHMSDDFDAPGTLIDDFEGSDDDPLRPDLYPAIAVPVRLVAEQPVGRRKRRP